MVKRCGFLLLLLLLFFPQRLNQLGAKLHEAQLNLESLRIKAEELAVYRDKCARLEPELIVLQEMYRRLEEINRRGTHDASQIHSRDELAKELKSEFYVERCVLELSINYNYNQQVLVQFPIFSFA